MVPFFIFVAGVAVGIGACKLFDVLKDDAVFIDTKRMENPQSRHYEATQKAVAGDNVISSNFDISPLEPIMRRYGVDITSSNCLYILCNQIKSNTYKRLLDEIVEKTKTGEDLLSFINNVQIETFVFPTAILSKGNYFVPVTTIDKLMSASALKSDMSDPKNKVEMLINSAYASAVVRLKNSFGVEFGKLIKAHEEGRELQSYYQELINEIKISRDFIAH